MGESVEPVVFAMARDFFPRQEERPLTRSQGFGDFQIDGRRGGARHTHTKRERG